MATLSELETRLERIELELSKYNTRNEIIALTGQHNTQHASVIERIQELEARVDRIVTAQIDIQRVQADHEERITALE